MNLSIGATMLDQAQATAGTPALFGDAGTWGLLIMLVLMFVVLYFFAIRPQKKREKEEQEMRSQLGVGDNIVTIGGMTGRIISVNEEEDEIILETGSNKSHLTLKRWAIQGKVLTEAEQKAAKEAAAKAKEEKAAAKAAAKEAKKAAKSKKAE